MNLLIVTPDGRERVHESVAHDYFDYLVELERKRGWVDPDDPIGEQRRRVFEGVVEQYDDDRRILQQYFQDELLNHVDRSVPSEPDQKLLGYHSSAFDDRLELLIERFEAAEDELIGRDDDTDWSSTFEWNVYPICEFALDRGLGILLT